VDSMKNENNLRPSRYESKTQGNERKAEAKQVERLLAILARKLGRLSVDSVLAIRS
jgi:hypothetical protein